VAISTEVVSSNTAHGKVYSMQHYVIKYCWWFFLLEECQNRYGSYPRGATCYCTNFMGCYHRHFQVKPEIKVHGGLILNFESGIHDYHFLNKGSAKHNIMLYGLLIPKFNHHLYDNLPFLLIVL
jgi:hypothetical protein